MYLEFSLCVLETPLFFLRFFFVSQSLRIEDESPRGITGTQLNLEVCIARASICDGAHTAQRLQNPAVQLGTWEERV